MLKGKRHDQRRSRTKARASRKAKACQRHFLEEPDAHTACHISLEEFGVKRGSKPTDDWRHAERPENSCHWCQRCSSRMVRRVLGEVWWLSTDTLEASLQMVLSARVSMVASLQQRSEHGCKNSSSIIANMATESMSRSISTVQDLVTELQKFSLW